VIKDEKLLKMIDDELEIGEEISMTIKGKYFCYTLAGVKLHKNAYVSFTNKAMIISVKEAVGYKLIKYKYKEMENLDLISKKSFYEVKVFLSNKKQEHITEIKELEDVKFLSELSHIISH